VNISSVTAAWATLAGERWRGAGISARAGATAAVQLSAVAAAILLRAVRAIATARDGVWASSACLARFAINICASAGGTTPLNIRALLRALYVLLVGTVVLYEWWRVFLLSAGDVVWLR